MEHFSLACKHHIFEPIYLVYQEISGASGLGPGPFGTDTGGRLISSTEMERCMGFRTNYT